MDWLEQNGLSGEKIVISRKGEFEMSNGISLSPPILSQYLHTGVVLKRVDGGLDVMELGKVEKVGGIEKYQVRIKSLETILSEESKQSVLWYDSTSLIYKDITTFPNDPLLNINDSVWRFSRISGRFFINHLGRGSIFSIF